MLSYQIAVVLHVTFAALWFGAPLAAGPALRIGAQSGREAFLVAATVAQRSGKVAAIGNLGVLLTGVALIFVRYGGMAALPVRFHIALGLVTVAFVIGVVFLRTLSAKIVAAAQDPSWTPSVTDPLRKKLAMFGGISHLIWLISLILMYSVRFGTPS